MPEDVRHDDQSDGKSPSEPVNAETERTGLSDQTNYVPPRQIISIFLACATVGTTGLLDETMVWAQSRASNCSDFFEIAVALPIMGAELHAGSQIAWIATAYFM